MPFSSFAWHCVAAVATRSCRGRTSTGLGCTPHIGDLACCLPRILFGAQVGQVAEDTWRMCVRSTGRSWTYKRTPTYTRAHGRQVEARGAEGRRRLRGDVLREPRRGVGLSLSRDAPR